MMRNYYKTGTLLSINIVMAAPLVPEAAVKELLHKKRQGSVLTC
jgi:hypothetical protein